MSEELTLEKLRIDERLRAVEEHMAEGKPIREQLIQSMSILTESITKLEHTVFGNGVNGVVQKVDRLEGLAKVICSILSKILWLVASAVVLAALPRVVQFLHLLFPVR